MIAPELRSGTIPVVGGSLPAILPAIPPTAMEPAGSSIAPRLGQMGEQLRQTSQQIQDAVVEVCASFQGIADRASNNVARTTALLAGGEQGAGGTESFERLVSACETTLTRILTAQKESAALVGEAVGRLQAIDGRTREVVSFLGRMEEIARGNKILALNAQIEAARSGHYGGGFRAVAVELSSQTDLSQQVTSGVADLIEALRSLADSAMNDLRTMQVRTEERAEQSAKEVERVLGALRRTHEGMQDVWHEVKDESSLLARDIGLAIRGLQFQDRVSQRIDHVVRDLELIQRKLPDLRADTWVGDGFSTSVMQEERAVYGIHANEAAAGDVELF